MDTPNGLQEVLKMFGDIRDPNFVQENIVLFDLPFPLTYIVLNRPVVVTKSRCHKLMVPVFQEALSKVNETGCLDCFSPYGGIYNARPQRNFTRVPSTHSWGISIDGNPEKFPLGSTSRMPDEVVKVFTDLGFVYGGDFVYRKDPQHFQFCKGF